MVDHRTFFISRLTLTIIILCLLPFHQTEKAQKSSAKLSSFPSRRIVPISSSELLAAQLLKEPFPQFDATKLKRTVRKLENDGSGDSSSLDAVNPDEYQGVVGRPGIDFPVLATIPTTKFSCRQYKSPGYYADLDTNCQVFHICDGGQKISFLCPNGTIFRQSHLICDWWFRVDCSNSVNLYEESAEQLAIDQKAYKSKTQENINQKENYFQEKHKTTPPSNSFLPSQTVPQDPYTSKTKASGNQPLQQSTFSYQTNQKSFVGNHQKQFPEIVNPSPETFYAAQNRFQTNPYSSNSHKIITNNVSGNSFSSKQQSGQNNVASQSKNYNPSNSKTYSEGNSLDNESQVLAESVNYGASKQNRYNPENYYSIDGTQKQYTPYQQNTVYAQNKQKQSATQVNQHSQSTLNQKDVYSQPSTLQPPSNYSPSSTAQQGSTFTQSLPIQQSNINPLPSTVQRTTNYPQSTTVQQPSNYPQTTTFQQNTNYPQSTTLQQNINYPQTTLQQNTNYPQTTLQQNTNYPKTTLQQSTNYPQTTLQQNIDYPQTTLQQNTNYPQSTTFQQNTNYPQSTTLQQNTNYPKSTTQQGGSFSQPSTVQQNTFYQQNTNSPQSTTYQSDTTYQQGTSVDFFRSQNISSNIPLLSSHSTVNNPTSNYISFTTPSYQETSTPVYSTIRESTPAYSTYTTLKDNYPSTFSYNPSTVYSTFSSNPTTNPELVSTLNFNRVSLEKSNLVPESINNAVGENSNGDAVNLLDSISIYYDQINNKESVQLPFKNQDSKNKISVSDIFLNQDSQVPLSPASFDLSNALPSVLTDSTKEGYSYLFSNGSHGDALNKENAQPVQEFPQSEDTFATQQNQGIFQSSYSTTTTTESPKVTESQKDLELRHSSDLRELAQVFSRALSAYLEDPENFRRILSEVRPTEPNIKSTTANPYKNEVLEFSEDIKFSPSRNPSSTPTAYTTVKEGFRTSSIANQVNNLVTDTSLSYFPPPKNLYGGFQNNSYSLSSSPNSFEGTTQTYVSVSPLVDASREPKLHRFNSPTTPIPILSYDERSSNAIGAQEVNNLVPSKNQYEDEFYDKNNVFGSDKYDYSFGANSKKSTQQYVKSDELESLVPYDSQSIVSRDNLLRIQNAQQKYYSTFKYGPVENFSKQPETYQTPLIFQSTPSVTPTYYYNERFVSQNIPSSTYSTVNFVPTESTPFLQSSSPLIQNQFIPQEKNNNSMYQEAKELFGNLNETSANILMHMMHEAESNSTLRRLVLLLVNDKTGKKTPEESRNKLLEALLQMPQRVPSYPLNSISRTSNSKVPRRVKVVKGRMLTNNERSSNKYNRNVKVNESKPANNVQPESLLPEKLSSESDTRAVELLKSLYVLAAKWG